MYLQGVSDSDLQRITSDVSLKTQMSKPNTQMLALESPGVGPKSLYFKIHR